MYIPLVQHSPENLVSLHPGYSNCDKKKPGVYQGLFYLLC